MKQSKYNTATKKKDKPQIDGHTFDSDIEAMYYSKLKRDLSMESIKKIDVHPSYPLVQKFEKYGKKHRPMVYKADFEVVEPSGAVTVIDIKGLATEAANIKRKLFDSIYPEKKLIWLSYSNKHGGWIEYDALKKARRDEKRAKNAR